MTFIRSLGAFCLMLLIGCSSDAPPPQKMTVTATAYNSVAGQTNANPSITAFGDTLKPGLKAIAVSRDLLDSGLLPGTNVRIEGLPGTYQVMDKMNRRWQKKIDIYMGTDVEAARNWGKREVRIEWQPTPEE